MVIHVRNNGGEGDPDAPGSAGWELVHEAAGHEAVIDKRTPDAFDSTGLGGLLRRSGRLSSPACKSEYCVRETSLAALGRGLAVVLARGAHATYGRRERTAQEIAAQSGKRPPRGGEDGTREGLAFISGSSGTRT
jgi:nicotinamidase-related amidase